LIIRLSLRCSEKGTQKFRTILPLFSRYINWFGRKWGARMRV
jgi:hypothetical protein